MTQTDIKRDKYLSKKYAISLSWYNIKLVEQNGGCAICHKPPKEGKSLHIDHDHKIAKLELKIVKQKGAWVVMSPDFCSIIRGVPRKAVVDSARRVILRRSIRGLLCWSCNTALQKFRDDPDKMESSAKYIRDYQSRLKG
jgi:hypothetical protein